jgi:heptosyltransferase-2
MSGQPRKVARILVRTPNWLGDAVLSLPAIEALEGAYPRASITLLAHKRVADLFRLEVREREVIPYDPQGLHRGVRGLARMVRDLKRRGYDLAIVYPHSFSSAWMTFLAGIRHRAGYIAEGRGRLLTLGIPLPGDYRKQHLSESYLDLTRALRFMGQASEPRLALTPGIKSEGREVLRAQGVPPDAKLIGFGPGATYGDAKRWDEDRFGELGKKLAGEGYRILLLGVKEEHSLCEHIRKGIGDGATNLAGRVDLKQLSGVLAQCRAFVSNDTGVMHLASGLGVPVVALFGSTSPEWTRPLGRAKVIYKHPWCSPCFARTCPDGSRRCWKAIEVEEVYRAVQEYLR